MGGELVEEATCPTGDHDALTRQALNLFTWAREGVLPYEGGLYDQPNRLIEMIEAVEMAYSDHLESVRRR